MRRILVAASVLVPFLIVGAAAWQISPGSLEERVASLESRVTTIEALLGATPTAPPTERTTTGPTAAVGPTSRSLEPALHFDPLRPIRTPAQAADDAYYTIDMRHLDLPEGPAGLLMRQRFKVSQGWEFFDRWHYSCVSMYLQYAGTRIAQVVYRTADGAAYTQLNDAHGNEMGEGSWTGYPSRCALEQGAGLGPEAEIETRPDDLQTTSVQFVVDGVTQTTFVCPATSPRNADTWCEVDEEASTRNHVTLEVYWKDDLIARVDIDRMSRALHILTS
jgi:hypothetical protein